MFYLFRAKTQVFILTFNLICRAWGFFFTLCPFDMFKLVCRIVSAPVPICICYLARPSCHEQEIEKTAGIKKNKL